MTGQQESVKLWQLTARPRSLHGIICAGVWTPPRFMRGLWGGP